MKEQSRQEVEEERMTGNITQKMGNRKEGIKEEGLAALWRGLGDNGTGVLNCQLSTFEFKRGPGFKIQLTRQTFFLSVTVQSMHYDG